MTLDEVRAGIDEVDSQMKPLFLKRMECARQVADVKAKTGGDVFVLERELAIIEKRAGDVEEVHDEYVAFLRHLMSVSRRYQYGILEKMQEEVVGDALKRAGLDGTTPHTQVEIAFSCPKETSDLNLYINMIKLNGVTVEAMSLATEGQVQKITMTLDGSVEEQNMKTLLCQIGKEAEEFAIRSLK